MTNKWSIGWGPISACNMKCKFCYSRSNRELPSNLEYLDWIRFIDNNAEHIGSINYGTGENTMSPEWFKLIDYIRTNYPLNRIKNRDSVRVNISISQERYAQCVSNTNLKTYLSERLEAALAIKIDVDIKCDIDTNISKQKRWNIIEKS